MTEPLTPEELDRARACPCTSVSVECIACRLLATVAERDERLAARDATIAEQANQSRHELGLVIGATVALREQRLLGQQALDEYAVLREVAEAARAYRTHFGAEGIDVALARYDALRAK